MTPSSARLSARATRPGCKTEDMKMKIGRMKVATSITAMRRKTSDERYRRYAEAKRKIPMNLPPTEYEAEIKRLARKYKI